MYEVIRPIAAGHQGIVHLARREDGELVALKRLAFVGDPAERGVARRRLRREAELLREAQVDGVVPLLDVVEEDDGDLVLVMPYLAGGGLHDRVHTDGPVPPEQFAALATPLLRTLAAIHRKGVLHRDIKPSNVLFHSPGGRPWLVDFGIGTARDLTEGLSAAGHLLGTPAFIAPERARGEAATPASDVYSLGATLRFALTGMPPHGVGDVVSVVGRAAAGKIEPLPRDTDPQLVDLLDRMCALDPADRPTAAELVAGPEGTAVGLAGLGTPTAPPQDTGRRPLRRAHAGAGAAALLLLGVAVGLVAADRIDAGGRSDAAAGTLDELVDAPTTSTTAAPTTTTTVCVDLPYQGCDDPAPAPGTDGHRCLEGRYDHDEDPSNGCEAEGDDIDDAELRSGSIQGTIIPVGDGDKILVPVTDRWQLFCDGRLTLALTAPDGLDLEMRVFDRGEEIGLLEVSGGDRERLRLGEPSCANNDSTTLEVVIRGTDGRSSDPWILERSGSW